VLSEKALIALAHLEKVAHEISSGAITPTRQVAEDFQPKLGALIAFTGGGVLRPGSVSSLFLRTISWSLVLVMNLYLILDLEREGSNPKVTVDEIRSSGYLGPLSMVTWHKASNCFTVSLLAYKNMAAHAHDEAPPRYVISAPVSRLLLFFASTLRVRFPWHFLNHSLVISCLLLAPSKTTGEQQIPLCASRR